MSKLSILVIENFADDRERLMNALLSEPFTVFQAASKEEALAIAERERPSMVIADIELIADSNDHLGIDAALEIQQRFGCGVIYLTGSIGLNQVAMSKILKTKDADYIRKPFEKAHLLSAINNNRMRVAGDRVVFISYHHRDFEIVEEMLSYLKPLKKVGILPWMDSQLKFGTKWKEEIHRNLAISVAAIMICSQGFANSDFISEVELPTILKQHQGGTCKRVYVVHYKPTVLRDIKPLLEFESIGTPDKPLSQSTAVRRAKEWWIPLREQIEKDLEDG